MIKVYDERYKEAVIELILHIQNIEYEVGISVEDQPDILDIQTNYIDQGGNFWVALNDTGAVVGSIGLQKQTNEVAVLKKFFVDKNYRGKTFGIGTKLYNELLDFTQENGFTTVILDTPSKATRSHGFYKKVGFQQIDKDSLPVQYDYPDRDSLLFQLNIDENPVGKV